MASLLALAVIRGRLRAIPFPLDGRDPDGKQEDQGDPEDRQLAQDDGIKSSVPHGRLRWGHRRP